MSVYDLIPHSHKATSREVDPQPMTTDAQQQLRSQSLEQAYVTSVNKIGLSVYEMSLHNSRIAHLCW